MLLTERLGVPYCHVYFQTSNTCTSILFVIILSQVSGTKAEYGELKSAFVYPISIDNKALLLLYIDMLNDNFVRVRNRLDIARFMDMSLLSVARFLKLKIVLHVGSRFTPLPSPLVYSLALVCSRLVDRS